MTIRIYNSLSKKKETFKPIKPNEVGMYVCGPTVYDDCHIGHARSVVVFDVIARYFRQSGFKVTYVRNFTDVDDKIINRANQVGMDWKELAEKYIKAFHRDMDLLNVARASHEPKATEHIDHIIKVIEILIQKGIAYQVEGDVYFAVEKFEKYGHLAGRKLEDMAAGARVEIDERKNNPFDFALWKSSKPGEPYWESPWGNGRPGWHIECSAMSVEYLGGSFDIHGGGKDLIFPHHENELAQSETAFSRPFVNYWVHNGFVNINHEKMSKSLGNFLLIKDVIKTYHPETVRLFLLSNHYRSPIDFTEKNMEEAGVGLDKIYGLLSRAEGALEKGKSPEVPDSGIDDSRRGKYWQRFCEAMDDDFNTALGVGILFEAVRFLNRMLDDAEASKVGLKSNSEASFLSVRDGYNDILKIGKILGILTQSPADYFSQKQKTAMQKAAVDADWVEEKINERIAARKAKDWATADSIRKALEEMNIIIEDRPDGTIWKIKD